MFLINLAEILASFFVTHFLNVQIDVAKRWRGVELLVKYVGAAAIDTMAAVEKGGLYRAPDAFKDLEGIMPDQFREMVGDMDVSKKP